MLVSAGSTWGTIGAALEFRAIEQARRALDLAPGSWRVQDYPLGPLLGQCCGGRVRLLIEHLDFRGLAALQGARRGAAGQPFRRRAHRPALDRRWASRPRFPRGPTSPKPGTRMIEPVGQWRRPVYLFGAGHVGQAIARHMPGLPLRLCWFDTRPMFESLDGVTVCRRRTSSPAWPKRRRTRPS
jgi:xanthine dehydrogenase accessory factor